MRSLGNTGHFDDAIHFAGLEGLEGLGRHEKQQASEHSFHIHVLKLRFF